MHVDIEDDVIENDVIYDDVINDIPTETTWTKGLYEGARVGGREGGIVRSQRRLIWEGCLPTALTGLSRRIS